MYSVSKNRLSTIATLILLLSLCLGILQCRSGVIDSIPIPFADQLSTYEEPDGSELSCSQEYAGELLAYFMRVVLGQAGQPNRRAAWRTRALNQPLDLAIVVAKMEDASQTKSQLMVMDTNMLGFSEVLYHYDPQLNQFKGRFTHHSIYPSPELIALRMLLIKKIDRGQKVDLRALLAEQDLLLDPQHEPAHGSLSKMNLSIEEYRLLRQVFRAAPQLLNYLSNPFLVKSLADVGAIRNDRYVRQLSRRANYKGIYPPSSQESIGQPALTIAILPSMTQEFLTCDQSETLGIEKFVPTDTYRRAAADLQQAILEKAAVRLTQTHPPSSDGARSWKRLLKEQVRFFNAEKRPLLVYPQNADRVLADICPHADFAIVLLGKDVNRAVDIDLERDTYPRVNRIYLDIGDVRNGYSEDELEQVSDLIYSKIMALVSKQPRHRGNRRTAEHDRFTADSGHHAFAHLQERQGK